MDLQDVEGLTEAQTAAILAKVEAVTSGLKSKNEQLLTETKTVKGRFAEQEQIAADAREAAALAAEERMKASNDMEGLKAHYEEQLATATAAEKEAARIANERLERIHKDSAVNKVLSGVSDKYHPFVKSQLENSVQVSYNENNEPVIAFTDNGNVVAASVDDFIGWAGGQDTWKAVLKGVDSSGAGSANSVAGSAGAVSMTDEQKRIHDINQRFKKV